MAKQDPEELPVFGDVTVTRIGDRPVLNPYLSTQRPPSKNPRQRGAPDFTLRDIQALEGESAEEESQGPVMVDISPSFTLRDMEDMGHVSDPREEMTPSEIGSAITEGALFEYVPFTAAVAGAVAGAKAGVPWVVPATPFMGPAAGLIPVLTGGVGAVLSFQGAKSLTDSLIEQPTPEDMAYVPFEAGRTFGSSIALAPLAFFIPQSWGARFASLDRIKTGATKYPKSYLLGETTAAVSASGGAAVAEMEFPGSIGARLLGEVIGGVTDPLRFVPVITSKVPDVLKTGYRAVRDPSGFAESRAAQTADRATERLITLIEREGGDPEELIRQLELPLVADPSVSYGRPRTGPTAAQKTGSVFFAELEAALSALDPKYAADVTEQGKQALKAYSLTVERLTEIGSPSSLRAAAKMRQDFFDNALESRLNRAVLNARERISRITKDTPEARAEISLIFREELELARDNAREAERIFWKDAIDQARTPTGTQRVTETIPANREITEAYLKEATNVLDTLRAYRRQLGNVDFNNARQVSRVTGEKAISFTEYVKRELGGFVLDAEFRARDLNGNTRPGLFLADTPANRSKAGMDAVRQAAFDGGYFPDKTNYNQISDDEIYAAVLQDTRTSRLWKGTIREKLIDLQNRQDYLAEMNSRFGVTPDMSAEQVAARLRAADEAAQGRGDDPFFVSLPKQRQVTRTVPRPNALVPQRTIDTYLERLSEISPDFVPELVPSSVIKTMNRLGITPAIIARYKEGKIDQAMRGAETVAPRFLPRPGSIKEKPAIELLNDRSNLLSLARQARAKGELSHANFYSTMAEAMLDDLSTLPGNNYDIARNYSRALNDVFRRSSVDDVLATNITGEYRIPTDLLFDRLFGSGADRTALRMREIETAVAFLKNQLDEAAISGASDFEVAARLRELASVSSERIVSIQDAQNRVLRLLANKALREDPTSGGQRLNVVQLNKFVAENKGLLDKMGITPDLMDAAKAENLLAAVKAQNSALNTTVRNQMAFSKVLAFESPTYAVANALSPSNKFITRSMRELANLARKGGPEAIDGLKASVYDYAFTKASGGTDSLNPQVLYDTFFTPYAKDQPALASILVNSGVMTPGEIRNLRDLTNQMRIIEDAMANRTMLEGVVQGADIVGELAMRVIGSRIGTSVSAGGPASLIAASAGSKAMRQLFDKMPAVAVRKLIQEATQDPQLMAQLLRRGMSEREKLIFARRMHAYLLASGLTFEPYEEQPGEAEILSRDRGVGTAARDFERLPESMLYKTTPSFKPLPPAPTTRGIPGMPGGGPPPAGGGAPPTTQSRMMLQQLFPNDPIIGAAATQAGAPPMPR